MNSKLLDIETKKTTDEILTSLVRTDVFSKNDYSKLLELTGLVPDKQQWLRFLYGFIFSLGTVFLLLGVILFFAWNWSDLTAYQKLILVEGILVLSTLLAIITNCEHLAGKMSVTVMCVMTGVVFAVYGQIYQTGADNYRLFTSWSLLILVPVMMIRFAPLWLFWITLMNLALVLWVSQTWFGSNVYLRTGLALGLANFFLILIWSAYIYTQSEKQTSKISRWIAFTFRIFIPVSVTDKENKLVSEMQLWMFRIIYIFGLFWLTITLFRMIGVSTSYYSNDSGLLKYFSTTIILLYLVIVGIVQYLAQRILKDMFIYTLTLFSVCSLISMTFMRLLSINQHTIWLLSLFVIFLAAAAAHWLRKVQNKWKIDS